MFDLKKQDQINTNVLPLKQRQFTNRIRKFMNMKKYLKNDYFFVNEHIYNSRNRHFSTFKFILKEMRGSNKLKFILQNIFSSNNSSFFEQLNGFLERVNGFLQQPAQHVFALEWLSKTITSDNLLQLENFEIAFSRIIVGLFEVVGGTKYIILKDSYFKSLVYFQFSLSFGEWHLNGLPMLSLSLVYT